MVHFWNFPLNIFRPQLPVILKPRKVKPCPWRGILYSQWVWSPCRNTEPFVQETLSPAAPGNRQIHANRRTQGKESRPHHSFPRNPLWKLAVTEKQPPFRKPGGTALPMWFAFPTQSNRPTLLSNGAHWGSGDGIGWNKLHFSSKPNRYSQNRSHFSSFTWFMLALATSSLLKKKKSVFNPSKSLEIGT